MIIYDFVLYNIEYNMETSHLDPQIATQKSEARRQSSAWPLVHASSEDPLVLLGTRTRDSLYLVVRQLLHLGECLLVPFQSLLVTGGGGDEDDSTMGHLMRPFHEYLIFRRFELARNILDNRIDWCPWKFRQRRKRGEYLDDNSLGMAIADELFRLVVTIWMKLNLARGETGKYIISHMSKGSHT